MLRSCRLYAHYRTELCQSISKSFAKAQFLIHKIEQRQFQSQTQRSENTKLLFEYQHPNYPYFNNISKTMSGHDKEGQAIIDDINRLIAMIDQFQARQPSFAQNDDIAVSSSSNYNASAAPYGTDVAFWPSIPIGHTDFSWNYETKEEFVKPMILKHAIVNVDLANNMANKPSVKGKEKQQTQKQNKQGKQQKQQNRQEKGKKGENKKDNNNNKEGEKAGASKKANDDNGAAKHKRRDRLLEIENEMQDYWDQAKVFESNPEKGRPKFMCTFPYPYMNGQLHLGHAFTVTKAEFAAGYQRLLGKNVLFPFGFHCTGMPIAAAANRIKEEMEKFGFPPNFDKDNENDETNEENNDDNKDDNKQRSKVAAKKSKQKYQWQIMTEFGLSDKEIARFSNPLEWLKYFPPIGMQHLKEFGLKVDWRRSFITTSANPYYDRFIQWQFRHLKKQGKIKFGKRPAVYSPKDGQVCADHDRASGETIGPQEYTLIKMELLNNGNTPYIKVNGDKLQPLFKSDKKVYMVAATLRPETMYGQTNCFVLPNGKYIAINVNNAINNSEEIFICSEHSARNMAHQEFTNQFGKYDVICEFEGWDLLGRSVKAPNATYDKVYVLPLKTIKMNKGTGIVTSVPSDAPADYAALKDAQNDEKFREKYYLTDEMVMPFKVIPIIHISEFNSNQAAVDLCEQEKVKSQNDVVKLEDIKDRVYKFGFSQGVMLVGDFKGEKVSVAKDKVKQQMIERSQACSYFEPENTVVSRTRDICVVAKVNQWYLAYGEDNWKNAVKDHIINTLNCYNEKSKDQFKYVIDWLHEWACSREFGLGTYLPWDDPVDPNEDKSRQNAKIHWVIESLSDSTIYMAFYTICHHLLNGTLDGSNGNSNPIKPEQMTDAVWDAIFLKGDIPKDCTIDPKMIETMRNEFEYWYPMDLRVSGKDLIFNHLTMSLYNHAAIWKDDPSMWPQSFFTNGYVLIDNAKMSKSEGNFLTLKQTIEQYSADATRFALAMAGDTLDDASFSRDVANAAIISLTKFEAFIDEMEAISHTLRRGDFNDLDKMFDNEINRAIINTKEAYDGMKYRDALSHGFHILESARDYYRTHVEKCAHKDIIDRCIKVQLILLTPICPHFCEKQRTKYGDRFESKFIVNERFPELSAKSEDYVLTQQFEFINNTSHRFRQSYSKEDALRLKKLGKLKGKKKKTDKDEIEMKELSQEYTSAILCVAADYKAWQKSTLNELKKYYDSKTNEMADDFTRSLSKSAFIDEATKGMSKKDGKGFVQNVMQFANYIVKDILPIRKQQAFNEHLLFNEFEFAKNHLSYLFHDINVDLEKVQVYRAQDANAPESMRDRTLPGKPVVKFVHCEAIAK